MFSAATAAPLTRSGPRPLPIVFSILAHGGLLALVASGPPSTRMRPRSLYDQVIKPHEHELVWYSFRQKLPEVSPLEKPDDRPPGAELKSPQTIVSKQGDRGKQMIWRPLPQIKPQPEVAAPNILAFRMPLIQPPPPGPPRKLFVPPQAKPQKPTDPAPALPEPPKVRTKVEAKQNPVLAANLVAALENRPKPRNFVPPVAPLVERKVAPALPQAPGLATRLRSDRVPLLAESMAAPLANKPQPRTFIPPAAPGRQSAGPVALPDAPKVAMQLAKAGEPNAAIDGAALGPLANKPKPRAFVPPATSGGGNGSGNATAVPLLQDAPSINTAGMPSANVNVAVVGLSPAGKLMGPLPDSSREAKFSAGPDANGGAGGGAPSSNSALSVPGLLVRGGEQSRQNSTPGNSLLIARAAPTSPDAIQAAAQAAAKAAGAGTNPEGADRPDLPAAEIRLAPAPDPQFNGREVHTLAVQMPNITSYVGSWIMWFAERAPDAPRRGRGLRPPVPVHKVDPKYFPAAIAERIEGKVQLAGVLGTNGRVHTLHVLKGVDVRLDLSAAEALQKWQFAPAERDGVPVEVDIIAEIPFLLAPQAKP
jgi:TonB family protein